MPRQPERLQETVDGLTAEIKKAQVAAGALEADADRAQRGGHQEAATAFRKEAAEARSRVAALQGRLDHYIAETTPLSEQYPEHVAQAAFEKRMSDAAGDPAAATRIAAEKEAARVRLAAQYPSIGRADIDGHIVRDDEADAE